ncbi:metallophosphoesterase [Lacibacter sp. H375]|uniref:metallophosphoesterase family protein n=1 Tax=Lacibacter sp. H375 TaxID=3133424 RepID=UPI0030BEFBE5
MNKLLYYLLPLLVLSSCKRFVFHPNEIRPQEKALNSSNIEKIAKLESKTAFNFILLGDTQRFYDEVDDFVSHVNSLNNVSFILVAGDLVDFGLNKEFNWIASKFGKLKTPYVAVIGNHDMLANGRKIFTEMFGPENFSFTYGKNKFICINSNSREVNYNGEIPDINWLSQQLNDQAPDNIFIVSHVPPFSVDFDKKLESDFAELLTAQHKTRLSLHGHEHQFKQLQPYEGGPTYVVAAASHKRSYVMITVNGEEFSVSEKFY